MGLSIDKILQAAANMAGTMRLPSPVRHLDIGPGHGDLIEILRTKFNLTSDACDYTDKLMHLKDVRIDIVDLNVDKLPYGDGSYDLVTCTEVLEHLEHYRETIREVHRILKSDGAFVLTTPNILNLKSRIRFMVIGFYNLFGPLHFNESELHSTGGHINPIGLYFLVHSLLDAGFKDIQVTVDKKQGTSIFWLLFLYLPIKFFFTFTKRREIKRYQTIDRHNEIYVDMLNRLDILLGRTLVIGCKK
ncbi:MAG: methyltransferase domain-containing protein [Polaromonas sp.]|uniref:class I SAM-dependent methyltransferase n=1 Tax=Polaromonas sp. TaxID=1869339 RepID=UPI0017B67097|nr:class I SAM-dependent methyltransferase [Polaromonas sp.]NMM11469.1 methyltransferase domain-containing protein [Polaromonas sp.]